MMAVQPSVTQAQSLFSDEEVLQERRTSVQLGYYLFGTSGDELPFWMHTNENARVDPLGGQWLNEVTAYHRVVDGDRFQLSAGGNGVLRMSENSSVHLSHLFLQADYRGWRMRAGRFDQPVGLNNHDLSIGSMMVSRNAAPIPRISLETDGFRDAPGLDGVLQYRAMFGHGWLEPDRYVEKPYLHQKYLYLRVNIGRFSGTGGMVHNNQWAGVESGTEQRPRTLDDYLRVILGRSASEDSNANIGEIQNVIGNSVAAYDFGLTYRHDRFTLFLTRMFYLEDKVSTRFRSPWDGVWGVNLYLNDQSFPVDALTYEHINTKNQDARSWELIGRRNYYNHYLYKTGWSYNSRPIGLPLMLHDGEQFYNNVLVGHHLGAEGEISDNLRYRAKLTYSRNYGVQDDWVDEPGESIPNDRGDIVPLREFRTDQYSWGLRLTYEPEQFSSIQFTLKLSGDHGELYEERVGGMVGVLMGF